MARILVGTLIEAGAHRMRAEEMADVIASRDRARAGDTAPAQGLCLYRVNYGFSQ